jgi:hypothetical protein
MHYLRSYEQAIRRWLAVPKGVLAFRGVQMIGRLDRMDVRESATDYFGGLMNGLGGG